MPVTTIKHVRPYHLLDLKPEYLTGGIWDGETMSGGGDINAQKAAAQAGVEGVINGIDDEIAADKATTITATDGILETGKSSWPFANQTAFENFMDSLKPSISGAINSNIGFNVSTAVADAQDAIDTNITGGGGTVLLSDAIQQLYDNYVAEVDTELTYPCPECGTTGLKPTYQPDGTPTGETEESTLCDGFGKTSVQYIRNPNAGFIEA